MLENGTFVFCSLPRDFDLKGVAVIAMMREPEGVSVVVTESQAQAHRWPILFRAAWIRLGLTTELSAVGLTVAVSAALAQAGIGCNMVAGAYHDHVFVPVDRAAQALGILSQLRVRMANN